MGRSMKTIVNGIEQDDEYKVIDISLPYIIFSIAVILTLVICYTQTTAVEEILKSIHW